MALIAPFRGLRYNPELAEDLSLVMAPPYDVISPEGQHAFHARHTHNVIRLILGETLADDDAARNQYSRAGDYLRQWQAEQVLVRDPAPALYLYRQTFRFSGVGERVRSGLIGLVRLEEFGSRTVFPHERTLGAAKADRLRLIQACHANLSSVFGVYPGRLPELDRLMAAAQESTPAIDIADWDGIHHRIWICQDRTAIRRLQAECAPTPLFIADGHHRYETALAFRDLMRAKETGDRAEAQQRPYNYVMMTLVSAEDPGLVILPIHRVMRQIPGGSLDGYLAQLAPQFTIEGLSVPCDPQAAASALLDHLRQAKSGTHCFGLYGGEGRAYLLTLADEGGLEAEDDKPPVYRRLDVTIVQRFLIDGPWSRCGQGELSDEALTYHHDAAEAVRMVQKDGYAATIFLNPTKIAEVQAVAEAGLRMPPKSTFFYPKLLTGLVIHPIVPDEVVGV
ncbi:hypothetical protein MELA_02915 [Candidatus Methylomirabilis lanthanidiphila]|uniref:DUF1015 domain-containing protein n=1 Tax=Candidatus Methylomirabilis lanthanidiphila TaxID=2211376 RepID=A0A564ZMH7_9BACT|nr:DUF1015 domain-containing protein [Candidatus Methylomirabilis lanthanidiphila]VUZ86511.1 hypothetical protein MELA_02915 [Candidatus Methylomirabilis lanthanidiphila]